MNLLISFYLAAYTFLFLALLGSYSFLGMNLLFSANWIGPFLPNLRKLTNLILPALFLWIGVAFLVPVYLKSGRAVHAEAPFRQLYLGLPFFLARALLYWGIWIWLARVLKRPEFKNGAITALLVLFAGSFAIFDWILVFEVGWYSTVFGLSLLLSALLITFHLCVLSRVRKDSKTGSFPYLNDWNSVQMALVALWTYLGLMQWITIWHANLPAETGFYLKRSHGIWLVILISVTLVQFVIPIFTLLFRGLKQSIRFTRALSYASLVIQFLFLYWTIAPAVLGGTP